jgi:hypothetical protein
MDLQEYVLGMQRLAEEREEFFTRLRRQADSLREGLEDDSEEEGSVREAAEGLVRLRQR